MTTPQLLLLAALGVASPTPLALAAAWSWHARRRNAAGRCAQCGGPDYAPGAVVGPSLVHSRLCCASCTARLRRRTQVALVVLGGLLLAGVTAAVVEAARGDGLGAWRWGLPVLVAGELGGYLAGAVALMRRANRRAVSRPAAERADTMALDVGGAGAWAALPTGVEATWRHRVAATPVTGRVAADRA